VKAPVDRGSLVGWCKGVDTTPYDVVRPWQTGEPEQLPSVKYGVASKLWKKKLREKKSQKGGHFAQSSGSINGGGSANSWRAG